MRIGGQAELAIFLLFFKDFSIVQTVKRHCNKIVDTVCLMHDTHFDPRVLGKFFLFTGSCPKKRAYTSVA